MSHSKEAKSSSCNNASRGRSKSSHRDNARADTRSKSRPAEDRIHSRTEASRRGRSRSISITRAETACPPTTPSSNKSQHYRQHRSRSRSVHRSKAYNDHDNHDSKKRDEDANVEYGYEDSQVEPQQQQQQQPRVRPNMARQSGQTRSTTSASATASRIRRSKSMVGSLTAGIMDNDSSKKIMVTEFSTSVDQELLNQRRARRRMSSFGCTSDLTPGGAGARPTLSKELQKRRSQRRIQVETIQSRERMQAAIFDRALQRRNSFLGKHHHEEQHQKQHHGESVPRNSRSNRHDRVQEDGRPSSRSSSRSRRALDSGSSSSHKRSSHHRSIQSSSHEYDEDEDDEEEDEKVRGDEHNRSQEELAHDTKPLPRLAPPRGSSHRRQLVLDDSQSMPKLAPLPPPRGSTHSRQSLVNMILTNRDKGDDDNDKDESDQDEFAEASWQEQPEPASARKPLPPNLNVSGGGRREKEDEEYFDNGMDEETIEETIVWSDEEKQDEIQHVERETQEHSQGRKRLPPKRNSKTAILEKAALGNALRKQAETEKYTPNPLVLNDVPLVPRDPFGDNSPLGTQRIRHPTLAVTAGAAKPPSQSSSFGKRNHSNNLTTASGKRTSSASLGVLKLGKILDESQSTQLTISSSVSGNSGGSNSIESLQQKSKMLSLGNKFRHCKSQTDTKVTGDTKHLTKNVSML